MPTDDAMQLREAVALRLGWTPPTFITDADGKPFPGSQQMPPYESSLSAAGEVLERLMRDGYGWNLCSYKGDYSCTISKVGVMVSRYAPTPAMAICKAFVQVPPGVTGS